jgi:hypothetical protein
MERMMISERDERLKRIRPEIETCEDKEGFMENFQNQVLRPVCKFQNSILIAQFKSYVRKFKPAFNAYNQSAQRNFIEDSLRRDPRIKNSLIASIVSVLTLEEYNLYCENKREVNKRIISLVSDRLKSHLEMIY